MRIEEAVPDFEQAMAVTSLGFVQPESDALMDDVRRHLDGDIVLTLTDGDVLRGYAVFRVDDDLLYLGGAMIHPDYQGKSIGRKFVEHAQALVAPTYLGLRTQSPIMWASGRRLCREWVPSYNSISTERGQLDEALRRAIRISGSSAHLDQGCYGAALYGSKPQHAELAVQRWWDSICNFDAGDAVVCVGRF